MLLAVFFVKDRDAAGFALKQFLVLKKIYAERAQVLKTNAWKEFWGEFAPPAFYESKFQNGNEFKV